MDEPTKITLTEGESVRLTWRPTGFGDAVMFNENVSEARLKVYQIRRGAPDTPIWSKTLTQDASGIPAGCLQPSGEGVLTDTASFDTDSDGYSWLHDLHPGDLDDNTTALAMPGSNAYRVVAELDADAGSGASHPEADDNGLIVKQWLLRIVGRP